MVRGAAGLQTPGRMFSQYFQRTGGVIQALGRKLSVATGGADDVQCFGRINALFVRVGTGISDNYLLQRAERQWNKALAVCCENDPGQICERNHV